MLATQVAAAHGVERTAEHLQINSQRLQQWVDQLTGGSPDSSKTKFIELPPLPTGPTAECHLEVEETSGRKLRIWLKGQAAAQAAEVVSVIWKEPGR